MLTSNKQLEDNIAPALQVTSILQGMHATQWWGLQPRREKTDVAQEAGVGTEVVAQRLKVRAALVEDKGLVPSIHVRAHNCL